MLFIQVDFYSFSLLNKRSELKTTLFSSYSSSFCSMNVNPCYLRYIFIKIKDVLSLYKMSYFLIFFVLILHENFVIILQKMSSLLLQNTLVAITKIV